LKFTKCFSDPIQQWIDNNSRVDYPTDENGNKVWTSPNVVKPTDAQVAEYRSTLEMKEGKTHLSKSELQLTITRDGETFQHTVLVSEDTLVRDFKTYRTKTYTIPYNWLKQCKTLEKLGESSNGSSGNVQVLTDKSEFEKLDFNNLVFERVLEFLFYHYTFYFSRGKQENRIPEPLPPTKTTEELREKMLSYLDTYDKNFIESFNYPVMMRVNAETKSPDFNMYPLMNIAFWMQIQYILDMTGSKSASLLRHEDDETIKEVLKGTEIGKWYTQEWTDKRAQRKLEEEKEGTDKKTNEMVKSETKTMTEENEEKSE